MQFFGSVVEIFIRCPIHPVGHFDGPEWFAGFSMSACLDGQGGISSRNCRLRRLFRDILGRFFGVGFRPGIINGLFFCRPVAGLFGRPLMFCHHRAFTGTFCHCLCFGGDATIMADIVQKVLRRPGHSCLAHNIGNRLFRLGGFCLNVICGLAGKIGSVIGFDIVIRCCLTDLAAENSLHPNRNSFRDDAMPTSEFAFGDFHPVAFFESGEFSFGSSFLFFRRSWGCDRFLCRFFSLAYPVCQFFLAHLVDIDGCLEWSCFGSSWSRCCFLNINLAFQPLYSGIHRLIPTPSVSATATFFKNNVLICRL